MRMQVLDSATPAWAAAVLRADELIHSSDFRPRKRSARTVAGFATIDGTRVFIKRVEEGSWLKGWIARLRGSRARRVLCGAAILKFAGFARPEPLAAAEARAVGAIRMSYVISEALDGSRIMSDVVLSGGRRNFRQRCEVSSAIAKQIRRLHHAGIYTLDLQETNVMISGSESGDWKIHFVDLEDFRRARKVSERRRLLNLVHLDRTIGRFLPRTQRLRFLYNYLGGRPARDEARQVLRHYFALRDRAQRRARPRPSQGPMTAGASDAQAAARPPGFHRVRSR
jgi:tRNA A-37 threonylcarbamoyl transferase component Bud32